MTTAHVPVLGITMGDPAGVGPEIIAKALTHPAVLGACRPVVIGDRSVMAATLALLRSPLTLHAVKSVAECTFEPGRLECFENGWRGHSDEGEFGGFRQFANAGICTHACD